MGLSEHLASTKTLLKSLKSLKTLNILYKLLINFIDFFNLQKTWKPRDNYYSLSKIDKIFISLSVLLRKIWFWYCQKQNPEYYEGLHQLHNNVTCNISQTYKYRNHPWSLLFHTSFLSQMVPLDSPCSNESGDILFVLKKCFDGHFLFYDFGTVSNTTQETILETCWNFLNKITK